MTRQIASALTAVALLSPIACGPAEDDANEAVSSDFAQDDQAAYTTVSFTPLASVALPAVSTATRKVFKSESTYKSFFGRASGLDFSRQWVVYYGAGAQRTGGYTASIESIQVSSSTLKVTTSLVSPGANCRATAGATNPGVVVAIAKPSPAPGTNRYVTNDRVQSCSGGGSSGGGTTTTTGLAILGNGSHALANVDYARIDAPSDGLKTPRDLAFNPSRAGELWVINRADDSTTTFFGVDTARQTSSKRKDGYALHFMEESSAIAFGQRGTFGTCGESRNTYDNHAHGNDFMGPTLWSDDPGIFAVENPIGLGSHLDMLHESPLCMGMAWDKANIYWVFDGLHSSINRYDFRRDHGPGYDDHSDGIIDRYVEGEVVRVPDVASHMELDHATGLLYIADTGNRRVAVLDTATGTRTARLPAVEPGTQHSRVTGARLTTLVSATAGAFSRPSGLAIAGGVLYVGDAQTGRISAFDLQGSRLDYLETGLTGALGGLTVDPTGKKLFFVNTKTSQLLRISAR